MFREIVNRAVHNVESQANLAVQLDISPSVLSKKMKGEVGWTEQDIDQLFRLSDFCHACKKTHSKELDALTEALRVVLVKREEE